MCQLHTIRYEDGRWCEQEYVDGRLHGRWTVFYANGHKNWERQYENGRQEGYQRRWDEHGRLTEEMWFHLDVLHGSWKTWSTGGAVEVVGDYFFGYPRRAFETTVNPDFNAHIKPHFGLEPERFEEISETLLPTIRRPTFRMTKLDGQNVDLTHRASFWNHVNVIGEHEGWPSYRGRYLSPILQINCADIPLSDNPLNEFAFVTLFSVAGGALANLGNDVVIRAYRSSDKLVHVEPPCDPLDAPSVLSFAHAIDSYPDANDLPPGLKVFLENSGDRHQVLGQDEALHSRLGGWPGWIQNGRTSGFGKFAFQVDSLDIEKWVCGDCTVHYFFLDGRHEDFAWCQEMC